MTAFVLPQGKQQYFTAAGVPLVGGKVFTYDTGTTTPRLTWADGAQVGANTNPVILDSRGEASIFWSGAYRVVLQDSLGNTIWTVDNIVGANDTLIADLANTTLGSKGAGLVGYNPALSSYTAGTAGAFLDSIYKRTAAEIAAGVTPVNYFYPPANVLRYATNTTPGTTNMTAAFNNAWLAYKAIYAPTGTYLVDTVTLPTTLYQRSLSGDGPGLTVLKQSATNADVLALGSGGVTEHTIIFEGFSIEGTSAGTGSGIRIPANGVAPPSNFVCNRLAINNMGGRGIYDQAGAFTSEFNNVQIDNCLDHQFDLLGGNTTTLKQCYAQRVPTAGKAGFRIHGAVPTLIGCNGINSGQYWGIFGDNVTDDGTTSYCRPTLIGCNIEDYGLVGIRNKNNGTVFINTAMLAPVAGVVTAYLQDTQNNEGFCDNVGMFAGTKGATFANGQPIHTKQNAAPFAMPISSSSVPATTYQFYDEVGALTYTAGAMNVDNVGGQRWAIAPGILRAAQLIQKRATLTYSASMTPDAATANSFTVTVTNATAFTFNAPTNPVDGQRLMILIRNTSGGAHGAITWNASYKVQAAAVAVGTANSRMIEFQYDAANWVEISRGYADVPN